MKSKLVAVTLLSVFAAAITLSTARAQQEVFFAALTGANEDTPNNSTATGFTTITLDLALMTMRVEVNFTGLSSGSTACHIHCPTAMAFTGAAGVATTTPTFAGFPSGVTSGTYDNTLDLTQASSFNPSFVTAQGSVSAAANTLISAIEQGKAYLNIHSTNFGGGEIRGFLAVPEPSTITFVGIGAVAMLAVLKRKKLVS
jgi:hypothetical protein